MEHSITHLEEKILSEITPEQARDLVLFMLKMPAPKRLDSSMTWECSHRLDRIMDTVRAFLTTRAGEQEVGI